MFDEKIDEGFTNIRLIWIMLALIIIFWATSVHATMLLKKNRLLNPKSLQDKQREERKRAFVEKAGKNYGYENSKVGHIDLWRREQLENLIEPNGKYQDDNKSNKAVYLDYAGAALPVNRQLENIVRNSRMQVLGNPHSVGPLASSTAAMIEKAKLEVLKYFCGEEDYHLYDIIFTSGATSSCRIVAENSPFDERSLFVYSKNSHTSVVGMRNPALSKGATCHCLDSNDFKNLLRTHRTKNQTAKSKDVDDDDDDDDDAKLSACLHQQKGEVKTNSIDKSQKQKKVDKKNSRVKDDKFRMPTHLLCCSLESNFDGEEMDLKSIVEAARNGTVEKYISENKENDVLSQNRNDQNNFMNNAQWLIMADIAKAAATKPINIHELGIDLACVSFYKMFGEPTGLGALIGKKSALNILLEQRRSNIVVVPSKESTDMKMDIDIAKVKVQKQNPSYFGGGTVEAWLPSQAFNSCQKSLAAAFADGTVHFRGIAALKEGFEELENLGGMIAVQSHVHELRKELVERLHNLKHSNGNRVIKIYGKENSKSSIVTFNVLRPNGEFVGYAEVSKLAALNQPPIQLRTGCFCNVGGCQEALNVTDWEIKRNLSLGHRCGDDLDLIDSKPTGAIRASLGKDSIWEDLDALACFLENSFCSLSIQATSGNVVTCRVNTEEEEQEVEEEEEEEEEKQEAKLSSPSSLSSFPQSPTLKEIYVYPVKSCAGIKVGKNGWPLDTEKGLLVFDREWAIVDGSGVALRMASYPMLARIVPSIDFKQKRLTLEYHDEQKDPLNNIVNMPNRLELGLDGEEQRTKHNSSGDTGLISVCGDQCPAKIFGGSKASKWLTSIVGIRCFLVRYSETKKLTGDKDPNKKEGEQKAEEEEESKASDTKNLKKKLSIRERDSAHVHFANESPILAISQDSVDALNKVLFDRGDPLVDCRHFRANFVIKGGDRKYGSTLSLANGENTWSHLKINFPSSSMESKSSESFASISMEVTGPCARCSMVDIDPTSGAKHGSTLRALASHTRDRARILFGVFCKLVRVSGCRHLEESNKNAVIFIKPNLPLEITYTTKKM